MTVVLGLVPAIPLVTSMVALAIRGRAMLRDLLVIGSLAAVTVLSFVLLFSVRADGPVVLRVGDWSPELGIVLVVIMRHNSARFVPHVLLGAGVRMAVVGQSFVGD